MMQTLSSKYLTASCLFHLLLCILKLAKDPELSTRSDIHKIINRSPDMDQKRNPQPAALRYTKSRTDPKNVFIFQCLLIFWNFDVHRSELTLSLPGEETSCRFRPSFRENKQQLAKPSYPPLELISYLGSFFHALNIPTSYSIFSSVQQS